MGKFHLFYSFRIQHRIAWYLKTIESWLLAKLIICKCIPLGDCLLICQIYKLILVGEVLLSFQAWTRATDILWVKMGTGETPWKEASTKLPAKHHSFPGWLLTLLWFLCIFETYWILFWCFSVLKEDLSVAEREVLCFPYVMENSSKKYIGSKIIY